MDVYDSLDTAAKAIGASIANFVHPSYPGKLHRGVIVGTYVEVRSYRGVEGTPVGSFLIEGHNGLFVADANSGWAPVDEAGVPDKTPKAPPKDTVATTETIEGPVAPHAAEEDPEAEPETPDFP